MTYTCAHLIFHVYIIMYIPCTIRQMGCNQWLQCNSIGLGVIMLVFQSLVWNLQWMAFLFSVAVSVTYMYIFIYIHIYIYLCAARGESEGRPEAEGGAEGRRETEGGRKREGASKTWGKCTYIHVCKLTCVNCCFRVGGCNGGCVLVLYMCVV